MSDVNKFPPCFTDFLICFTYLYISSCSTCNRFFYFSNLSFVSIIHQNLEDVNVLIEESMETYFLLQKLILTFDYLSNLHRIQNKLSFMYRIILQLSSQQQFSALLFYFSFSFVKHQCVNVIISVWIGCQFLMKQ